ncbi:6-phosphogluconolactonase [uncultured bacterium]|nr:6-phosphogluconolactonase [uncultured bacterium]
MARPSGQSLKIFQDKDSLARGAALLFIESFEEAVREKGFFSVVLSGGATPLRLYELLASKEYRSAVQWGLAHFFWGDERCVPPDSPESNFNAANQSLLSKIEIPPENIHRIKGELPPMAAAKSAEDELVSFFHLGAGVPPPFDLVLLGLGSDGHTLSLFPGTQGLEEKERLVIPNHVPKLDAWRVTLTFSAIEKAKKTVFLVSGEEKAAAMKEVFEGKDLPAARVRAKEVLWLADSEAAVLVSD